MEEENLCGDYFDVAKNLFKILAESNITIQPSLGARNLLFYLEGGCIFISPEKDQTFDIIMDLDKGYSNYNLKEVKMEGKPYDKVWFRIHKVDLWNFQVHRTHSNPLGIEFERFSLEEYISHIPKK